MIYYGAEFNNNEVSVINFFNIARIYDNTIWLITLRKTKVRQI